VDQGVAWPKCNSAGQTCNRPFELILPLVKSPEIDEGLYVVRLSSEFTLDDRDSIVGACVHRGFWAIALFKNIFRFQFIMTEI